MVYPDINTNCMHYWNKEMSQEPVSWEWTITNNKSGIFMQKYKTILKRISLPASWLSLSLLYFVFNKECFACQPPPLATTKYVKISGIYFVVFELRRISSCTFYLWIDEFYNCSHFSSFCLQQMIIFTHLGSNYLGSTVNWGDPLASQDIWCNLNSEHPCYARHAWYFYAQTCCARLYRGWKIGIPENK